MECVICGASIPNVNLQSQIGLVYCPNGICRGVYPCDNFLLAKHKPVDPQNVEIKEVGAGLRITIRRPVKNRDPLAMWGGLFFAWFLLAVPVIMIFIQAADLSLLQFGTLFIASGLICVVLLGSLLLKQKESVIQTTLDPDLFSLWQSLEYKDLSREQRRIRAAYLLTDCIVGNETFYRVIVAADGPEIVVLNRIRLDEAIFIVQAIKNYFGWSLS